jgi:uncharacterized membrane-anchored protein
MIVPVDPTAPGAAAAQGAPDPARVPGADPVAPALPAATAPGDPPPGAIRLPSDHPLRRRLADEVHARPPVIVPAPGSVGCIALLRAPGDPDDFHPLRELAARYGVPVADPLHPQLVVDLPPGLPGLPGLRVKWERHSEFTSYMFVQALPQDTDLAGLGSLPSVFAALPQDWLAALPGQTIAAVDVTLLRCPPGALPLDTVGELLSGPTLVGSFVSDAAARVFTDFMLTDDGRSRWLLIDDHLTRGQQARLTQRIVEIAIYRVMAMLAFPASRELSAGLTRAEERLSGITSRIADRGPARASRMAVHREERQLLEDLTLLAADVEKGLAGCAFRFSASQAYWDIVQNRVLEMREARLSGVPTLGEFLSRRLAPALNTVSATARRQQQLSARIARTSELLRTRVDVAREEQNQRILAAIDRRGRISLRLQQTVEGLSVAALTYYIVGLLGYVMKPLKQVFPALNPDWITAAAIPLLAFALWRGVHRIRLQLDGRDDEPGGDDGSGGGADANGRDEASGR